MDFRKEFQRITAPKMEGKRFLQKARHALKKPYVQFGLLFVVMILVLILSMPQIKIIPVSTKDSIAIVMIYAIASVGFCLLLGYSGLASLGTAGFIGIGSLITFYGLKDWGVTMLPSLLIIGVIAIVLGVVIGFVSLRIEGIYLAIMTLCMSEVIVRLLKALEGGAIVITKSHISFFGLAVPDEAVFIIIALVLVGLLIATANLINSPTGRAMQAMKSSTSAAQAMGISLMKYRLLAFVIATLLATVSGFFYMIFIKAISMSTSTVITLSMSLNILGAVIIGGAKSLWGTLFGTFFVFGLQTIVLKEIPFFANNPDITVLFTGVLMIVIVMFFPGGFAEIVLRIKILIMKLVKKWRIRRYGIEE